MRGIIVAAGEGKRMRPITYWRPKPLVPVADAPLIGHIIRGFVAAGVTEICIVVGHLAHRMVADLGDGSAWGARFTFVTQDAPRGTADAVLRARRFLADEPFLLSWGDILVPPVHYRRVVEGLAGADGVLSLNRVEDPWEGAAVYVREGFVDRLVEKPDRGTSTTNFNNAGIFVLPAEVLEIASRLEPSPRGEYELPVAMDRLLASGARLRAIEVEGRDNWSDVARPGAALQMNGRVIQWLSDGLWIEPGASVSQGVALTPPVYLAPGVVVAAGADIGPNVSLHEGCEVCAGAQIADAVILEGCRIGAGSLVRGAYLDTGAELPPGTRLPGDLACPILLPPKA